MAQPTYEAHVIVLRKTKLAESDLVLTMLLDDGSQLRAVAKGARKPTSSFSARLELYSEADVFLARGKSLDVVKEARLVKSNEAARRDMEHAAGAAPMAELLDRVTLDGLENPRLFALTQTALDSLGRVEATHVPKICAAQLLKTLAFVGLRPSLRVCVCCGREVPLEGADGVWLSFRDGGVVCPSCKSGCEAVLLPNETLLLADRLLRQTFAALEQTPPDTSCALGVLQFCGQWIREHVEARMKSLDFIFESGLF